MSVQQIHRYNMLNPGRFCQGPCYSRMVLDPSWWKKKRAPVQDSVLPGPNAGFMGSMWGPWQPELQWMGGCGLNWVLQLPERKEKKKGPPSSSQLWLLFVRKLGEVCRYWGGVPLGLGKHPRNPKSSCKWSDRFKGTFILPGSHFREFPYRGNLKNFLENSTE